MSSVAESSPMMCSELLSKNFVNSSKKSNEVEWTGVPKFEKFSGRLDRNVLKEKGFKYNPATNQLSFLADGKTKHLGKLKTLNATHLFEWADANYAANLQAKGVDNTLMRAILNEKGQASGKGFYVSLHPTDSQYFGDVLTVFNVNKPIVVLNFEADWYNKMSTDTNFIFALKGIGIDAIQVNSGSYRSTWLSFIRNQHLVKPSSPSTFLLHKLFDEFINQNMTRQSFLKFSKMVPATEVQNFPAIQLYQQMIKGKASAKDLLYFKNNYPTVKNAVKSDFAHALYQTLPSIRSFEELNEVISELHSSIIASPDNLRQEIIHKRSQQGISEQRKVYLEILKNFDFKDIVFGHRNAGERWSEVMKTLKEKASKEIIQRQNIHFDQVHTLEDLIAVAEKLYDQKFEFRDLPIYMGERPDDPKVNLTSDQLAYIQRNPFLSSSNVEELANGEKRAIVEYWHPKLDQADLLKTFKSVSDEQRRSLLETMTLLYQKKIDDHDPKAKAMTLQILKTALQEIVNNAGTDTRPIWDELKNYHAVVSLHSFRDGNGRFARLLYEFLIAKAKRGSYDTEPESITLGMFDLDLFAHPGDLKDNATRGFLLQDWVSQARNDEEFVQRSYWAIKSIQQLSHNSLSPHLLE